MLVQQHLLPMELNAMTFDHAVKNVNFMQKKSIILQEFVVVSIEKCPSTDPILSHASACPNMKLWTVYDKT